MRFVALVTSYKMKQTALKTVKYRGNGGGCSVGPAWALLHHFAPGVMYDALPLPGVGAAHTPAWGPPSAEETLQAQSGAKLAMQVKTPKQNKDAPKHSIC